MWSKKRNNKKKKKKSTDFETKKTNYKNAELHQTEAQQSKLELIDVRSQMWKIDPKMAAINQTEAQQNDMSVKLIDVAGKTAKLLENMGDQLEKEDKQRESLINFFKCFTGAITIVPLILVGIIYVISKGEVGFGTQLAALAAFINIPISLIGVLKCIAEGLFNDTYRKTMPEMITKITTALANYDVIHNDKTETVLLDNEQDKE